MPASDANRPESEIDAQLTLARDAVASIRGQVEAVTAQAAALSPILADIQDARSQAREASAQSVAVLEAAKAAMLELTALASTAQSTDSKAKESAAQVTAALESVRALVGTATESAGRIEALNAQVEQVAQVAATRSEHIEDGRKYVDAKRAEIDVLMNAAQLSANSTEGQHQTSKATGESISNLAAAMQTAKATAESNVEATGTARAAADKHAAVTARLAEIAAATEAKVADYEAKLTELQTAADEQRKIIDDLLLGATNAGLASAFDKRAKSFKRPEAGWQWVFLGSLFGLLVLAAYEAWTFGAATKAPEWQELGRMFVHRVPFLIPLIWLAIHSARQASFATRMEEEYAFKATISTSFEGYRRQMAEVSRDLAPNSPLARLCADTLATISTPPGLVYDKHRMDPTPGTAVSEMVKPLVEGVSKVLAAKTPEVK
jgi:hypothetical protein